MLRVAPKGQVAPAIVLDPADDALLRAAFGRYGDTAEARAAAADIVRHHQQAGRGRWILCDCLPGAERLRHWCLSR